MSKVYGVQIEAEYLIFGEMSFNLQCTEQFVYFAAYGPAAVGKEYLCKLLCDGASPL